MAWTYDATALGDSTAAERKNSVRFLVGVTDTNDQQVQDEEIAFALSETNNRVYYAASYIAKTISALYARRVTTKLDGALSAEYSDLSERYAKLAETLEYQGKKVGAVLNVKAGGIRESQVEAADQLTDRLKPAFTQTQFKNPPTYNEPYWDYD